MHFPASEFHIVIRFVPMEKLTLYLKESYNELMHNVSWPTSQQLIESAIVVLITSGILTLIVFLFDLTCSLLFKTLYNIL